ncbi:hypothetical protein WDU94_001756 [Cyamophila willieti]
MVNISQICKTFKSKMEKAVKSITILKRPGSSNSSIGTKMDQVFDTSQTMSKEDDAKLKGSNEATSDLSQNGTKEETELPVSNTSNDQMWDLSKKVSKEQVELSGRNPEVSDVSLNVTKEDFKLTDGTKDKLELSKNVTIKEDTEFIRSIKNVLDISQIGTKEEEEEDKFELSKNVTIKEDTEFIRSIKNVLDISQNGTKEEEAKLSESNEEILDLTQKVSKENIDISQNGTKEEEEAKLSESNEEILDLSQKGSKENIELIKNIEDDLNVTENNEDGHKSHVDDISSQPIEVQSLNSSPRNENTLENEADITNRLNENKPDHITEDNVTLPLEGKRITILKRPASCTNLTKNGAAPPSRLGNAINAENTINKNECGKKILEANSSNEISTESKSPQSASKERKQHQEEAKDSREVILKEETSVKPFRILKRPENAANGNVVPCKVEIACITRPIEPFEKLPIENENTGVSETTNEEYSLANEERKEEEPVLNFTILKRPEITNDKLENKSAAALTKTLEQRKREYDKARIRIFGKPGSYEEVDSEDESDIQAKSPTIHSHQESASSPNKSPPIPTSKSPKKKKFTPSLEQPSGTAAAPHVSEIPSTSEHYIETPNEPLQTNNEIATHPIIPPKEIDNSSGLYKEMSRNSPPDFYNEIPAISPDLPSGIHNEVPTPPPSIRFRSNGSQHPLHYYNQPLPNFLPFYNGMVDATSTYYCSGFDYNTQYGPFWSEGPTNYVHFPAEAEIQSYAPPFTNFSTNLSMPSEELFYTYINGYHIPGVNDFSYDVHVDDYSSYDLSFTDYEGTGVST